MKYKLLSLFLFATILQANAQKNFRGILKNENGLSVAFTKIAQHDQVVFNPANADALIGADAQSKLILKDKFTDNLGQTHYRFYQTYKGYEVQNSMFLFHTVNNKLMSMGGEMIIEFSKTNRYPTTAIIPAGNVLNIAMRNIGAKQYAWQNGEWEKALKIQLNNPNATYKPTAKLVWYNTGDEISPNDLRLAYRVEVYALQPLSKAYYFIDAQTGKLLGKIDRLCFSDAIGTAATAWSGTQTIHSSKIGTTSYILRDSTKGNGVITVHGESGKRGTDYTSTSKDWSFTNSDQASLDAHYGVSQTWSFYMTNFGRNSYDGNGTALYSYVNDPTYIDNAFWDGTAMNFNKRSTGENGGVTGIDVTGHELTHGVTQTTSGLVYQSQSGGINESLSDIMGKCVQFWSKPTDTSWLLSNDMNWIIRDMSNPNAYLQPDTYKGLYWSPFADVHTLSGVGNFMFYLLDHGGTGTNDNGWNYNVQGLGLNKADQIIYRSNLVYLTSNSKYPDWRVACINAATDLYGAGSNEVLQVKNSWYAVGIDSTSGITCAKPAGLAADTVGTTSAHLRWNPVTNAVSYNLQWKETSGTTWTTVSNISTNSYTLTGLSASTSYDFRVQTKCDTSLTSAYSTSVSFVTTGKGGYCVSYGTSTSYEYIQSVRVGNKKNNSGDDGGYGDYTSIATAPLKAGKKAQVWLAAGFTGSTYTEYFTVYIDYNRDRDFNDAGEKVGSVATSSTAEVPLTFMIPSTAKNGPTLIRVQMQYSTALTDPCAIYSYGETEDYSGMISGGTGLATDTYSSADAMNANSKANNNILVAPNPVKGNMATVNYSLVNPGNVSLRIVDLSGSTVQALQLGNQQTGTHSIYLSQLDKLAAGNYFIEMQQDDMMISRTRFVVMQ